MLKEIYLNNKVIFFKYYFVLILGMISPTVFPYYSGILLDLILKGSSSLALIYLSSFIVTTAILGAISYYYSGKYMAIIRENLNKSCYIKHMDSNLDIMAAKMSQMDDVRGFFTFDIPDLIKISTDITLVFIFLFFINWQIALIFLVDLLICILLLFFRIDSLREFGRKKAEVKEVIIKSYSNGIETTNSAIVSERDITIMGYYLQVKTYFSLNFITLTSSIIVLYIIIGNGYSAGIITSILLYLGKIDSILDGLTYIQLSIIRVLESLKKLQ